MDCKGTSTATDVTHLSESHAVYASADYQSEVNERRRRPSADIICCRPTSYKPHCTTPSTTL